MDVCKCGNHLRSEKSRTSGKCATCRRRTTAARLNDVPCGDPLGVMPTPLCACGNVLGYKESIQTGRCFECRSKDMAARPKADATKEGRKIGKVRMDLVMQDMPRAIEALARVMTWALEEKGYNESDWLDVPDAIRKYHGGMHRHDNKEMRGQEFDDESNLEHAIHTAWNAMARVELILRKKEAQ